MLERFFLYSRLKRDREVDRYLSLVVKCGILVAHSLVALGHVAVWCRVLAVTLSRVVVLGTTENKRKVSTFC